MHRHTRGHTCGLAKTHVLWVRMGGTGPAGLCGVHPRVSLVKHRPWCLCISGLPAGVSGAWEPGLTPGCGPSPQHRKTRCQLPRPHLLLPAWFPAPSSTAQGSAGGCMWTAGSPQRVQGELRVGQALCEVLSRGGLGGWAQQSPVCSLPVQAVRGAHASRCRFPQALGSGGARKEAGLPQTPPCLPCCLTAAEGKGGIKALG